MLDGHVAARFVAQSSRSGDQVEKVALTNRRVGPWVIDLSHQSDRLRGGLVHENGNVRAANKTSVLQPLLDQCLRFIGCQVRNVNIVNQGKVDVSGTTDARLGGEIGYSEHRDLDQIADAQLDIGTSKQTRRLRRNGLAGKRGLGRLPSDRCLGQKVEAAHTNNRHVQAQQEEAAIPPGHTWTPGFMRAASLTHATQQNRRRALRLTVRRKSTANEKVHPSSCAATATSCIVPTNKHFHRMAPMGKPRLRELTGAYSQHVWFEMPGVSAGRNSDLDAPVLWIVCVLASPVVCGYARSARLGNPQRLGVGTARWTACSPSPASPFGGSSDFFGFLGQLGHMVGALPRLSPPARRTRSQHAPPHLCSCLSDFLSRHLR